ncbi:MAG TPA: DUF4055 domain-containing protein [Abditibacteriaceae bacterium]|jgi:hypothetical protein
MADVVAKFNDVRFNKIPPAIRDRWKLIRDVVSGDQVLRTGDYLPFLNKHDVSLANVARNAAYRDRAVWFPATGFTLEGFLGLAFRNDPTSTLEGTKLEPLITNVDGAGVSLYQQSQATLANVIAVGRHGLLTDFSTEQKQPVIKAYDAESIVNWRYTMRGGKPILTLIVLYECVEVEEGPWAVRHVPQWRELYIDPDRADACFCRLWREESLVAGSTKAPGVQIWQQEDAAGKLQDELQVRSPGKVFTEIPFVFVGSQNNDGGIDPSPMYGLASINLAHFRNSADYEDSVFFVGQVQPYITGLTEEWADRLENPKDDMGQPTGEVIYVGSRKPLLLPENSTFGYAQAQPNTLVKEAIDQKEAQMVKVGARIIEGAGPGSRTATEDENDKEATTSVLSLCVSNVNEAYQRAIYFASQFLDMGKEWDAADAYKITQQFVRAAANPAIVDALVKMWQTGVISKDDVRDHIRKVGLIATERTNAEIEQDIEDEGPPLGMLGLAGTGPAGAPNLDPQGNTKPPAVGAPNPGNAKPSGKPSNRR